MYKHEVASQKEHSHPFHVSSKHSIVSKLLYCVHCTITPFLVLVCSITIRLFTVATGPNPDEIQLN